MTDQTINAAEAQALLRAGDALLIDVREPDEYAAAHIPQAISMPLGQVDALLGRADLPAGRTLIFQCLKGGRGGQACLLANQAGYATGRSVRNLAGGIEAWQAAGLPVVGSGQGKRGPAIPIMRQVQMVVGMLVLLSTLAGLYGFTVGFYFAAIFGAALAFAGLSGWCGMAMLLSRMPWNR